MRCILFMYSAIALLSEICQSCYFEVQVSSYAILCGSAPADYRQKKLEDKCNFLSGEADGFAPKENVIIFPNGVHELMLESVLNNAFDEVAEDDDGEVLLYLCALEEADLHAELSDSVCEGVEVVRLGTDEIRKDVIAYYEGLAERLGIGFRVMYDSDCELVSEKALGYEEAGGRVC